MALAAESLTMYYEDSVNYYGKTLVPLLPMTGVNKVADLAKASVAKVNDVAIASINILDKVFPGAAGGTVYYMHYEASDIAGYEKLLTAVPDAAKTSLVGTASVSDIFPKSILLGSWMTDAGVPGFAGSTPAGLYWITHLRQQRIIYTSGYTSWWTVRWYRYYDTGSGWLLSNQVAYTVCGSTTLTETTEDYTHSVVASTWGATDRLVAKVWANFDQIGTLT